MTTSFPLSGTVGDSRRGAPGKERGTVGESPSTWTLLKAGEAIPGLVFAAKSLGLQVLKGKGDTEIFELKVSS